MKDTVRGLIFLSALVATLVFACKARAQTENGTESVIIQKRTTPIIHGTWRADNEFGFDWNKAEKPTDKLRTFSVGFGGWSDHKNKLMCRTVKGLPFCLAKRETNPTIEVDLWLPFEVWGSQPFVGYGHIFENSNRGTTDWLILATQWKLHQGEYLNLCGGAGVLRARYAVPQYLVPGKRNSEKATLPALYLCLEKEQVDHTISMRLVPLGKDILFMYMVFTFK